MGTGKAGKGVSKSQNWGFEVLGLSSSLTPVVKNITKEVLQVRDIENQSPDGRTTSVYILSRTGMFIEIPTVYRQEPIDYSVLIGKDHGSMSSQPSSMAIWEAVREHIKPIQAVVFVESWYERRDHREPILRQRVTVYRFNTATINGDKLVWQLAESAAQWA